MPVTSINAPISRTSGGLALRSARREGEEGGCGVGDLTHYLRSARPYLRASAAVRGPCPVYPHGGATGAGACMADSPRRTPPIPHVFTATETEVEPLTL